MIVIFHVKYQYKYCQGYYCYCASILGPLGCSEYIMEGTISGQQDDLFCPIFAPDNVFFCPLKIKKHGIYWDL